MSRTLLTLHDDGRTVQVAPGDVIDVSLDENPTTGFRWAIDGLDSSLVEFCGDEIVDRPPGSGETLVGAGRRLRKTFRILTRGRSMIRLKEWRSWEGDASVRRRFSITVEASE